MKVSALTVGNNTPSARFRVRQYIEFLNRDGITVKEHFAEIQKSQQIPLLTNRIRTRYYFPLHIGLEVAKLAGNIPRVYRANKSDIVWLQRDLISGMPTLEYFIKKPIVFDIDDAIWLSKPFGKFTIEQICKRSSLIFAGNEFIRNYLSRYNTNIVIVPTAIDTDRFKPSFYTRDATDEFVIGWTGTSINLIYLTQIEKPLTAFLEKWPNTYIHILCDDIPKFKHLPSHKLKFTKWSVNNECEVIKNWDVGIMPLPGDEFSKGKCSFKMLQYMASEIPVIVSNVGMNVHILQKSLVGIGIDDDSQWVDALEHLYFNKNTSSEMGVNGRKVVLSEYSALKISKEIAVHFKSLRSGADI